MAVTDFVTEQQVSNLVAALGNTVVTKDGLGNVTITGDVSAVTVNGKAYYPIYPPGVTPASGDPTGLSVET